MQRAWNRSRDREGINVENLPAVFQAMIRKHHQAVTVGKMVRIGEYIADSCVVDATPAAAALYGVDDPAELVGCWQSKLQHPDDVRLGRILAQARRRGVEVPERYTSRIRQLRSPYSYVTVTKEVCQLNLDKDTYWFTVLSTPVGPPLMEQEDFWENLKVPEDVFSYLTNCISVAETERAIKGGTMPSLGMFNSKDLTTFRSLEIAFGESLRLPDESYLHRCTRCTKIWKSSQPDPKRCGKRGCHSPFWRTLAKSLRHLDINKVTTDQILASRKARSIDEELDQPE